MIVSGQLITTQDIAYEICSNNHVNYNDYADMWPVWVERAVQQIGIVPEIMGLSSETVDIVCDRFPKPKRQGYVHEIKLSKGCGDDCIWAYAVYGGQRPVSELESCCPFFATTSPDKVGETVDGFFLAYKSDYWETATVTIIGQPYASDGLPLVPWLYNDAVSAYVEYSLNSRLRKANRDAIPESEIQRLANDWEIAKRSAYSRAKTPSLMQMRQMIDRMYKQKLPLVRNQP
ncbi:MAG: hypothetical protein [Bacteriophage sp.]|nr:MAG: hypothetical protein [Bacteriophage sp.]